MSTSSTLVMKRAIERIPVHLTLLIAFVSLVLLVNAEWLAIDHRPPRWDESENLLLAEIAYQRLLNFDWGSLLVSNGTARPNFIPVLSALTFPLVGRDIDTTVFVLVSVSLVVTSVFLYDIGRRLLGRTAALLAVVLYNTLPGVVSFSRYYHMDIPLTAFVTATMWLVVVYLEEPAWRRWIAPWFGVTIAMGMCAKHLYPIYVVLPLTWMLIVLWRESEWRLLQFLRRHAVVIVAFLLGVSFGLFYLLVLNYHGFMDGVLRSFFVEKSALAGIGYVPPTLQQRLLGFEEFEFGGSRWFTALVLFGGVCALAFSFRRMAVVWLSQVGAYGFLLFILGPTDPSYFLAAMPGTTLIMSAFATLPSRLNEFKTARAAVLGLSVIVGGLSVRNYVKSSLDTNSPLAVVLAAPSILLSSKPIETNPVADSNYWNAASGPGNMVTLPYPHRWAIEDVLRTIRDLANDRRADQISIGLFSNYEWFNGHAFSYWLSRLEMRRKFPISLPLPPPPNQSPLEFLSRFDVLILKTGQILAHMSYPFAESVQTYFDHVTRNDSGLLRDAGWRLVKRWPLPDGSEATVWSSPAIERFRLTGMFESAEPSHRMPGYIVPWQGNVGGQYRAGIFMHPRLGEPASALTWRGIRVPPNASELAFGIGFAHGVCNQPAAPVRYRVDIAEGGETKTIFDRVFENQPCDKSKWNDFSVSLQAWQGKSVDLAISTRPAADNNITSAHAVWSGLEIR